MTRGNQWLSLRGTALEWWTDELSETEQRIAALGDGVTEWTRLLLTRFKQPSNVAIESMLQEKFTLKDASNHREPGEFAVKMLRSAKDAGLSDIKVQLDII
ncbi:hypothetical protein MMC12_003442 [Toensbergia leucococca]|nr:hypothetical protein [Toensbergia leucococca]